MLCVPCSSGGWWPIQHGANALDIAYVANVLRWRRSSLFASFFGLQGGTLRGPKWALEIHEEINIGDLVAHPSGFSYPYEIFVGLIHSQLGWTFCHKHDPWVVRRQPYPLDFAVVKQRWFFHSIMNGGKIQVVSWWNGGLAPGLIHMIPMNFNPLTYPDAPWCWNIYLQNWAIFGVIVGKYSSTMEHMG